MFDVDGVSRTSSNGRRVLINVSVSIGRGEMVALIGASGPETFTLIRHIADLSTANRGAKGGTIKVAGSPEQLSDPKVG